MRSWLGLVAFSATLILLVMLVWQGDAQTPGFGSMALMSLAVSGTSIMLVAARWGRDATSGPMLYVVLFLLFHLGLVITLGLGGLSSVAAVSPTAYQWVDSVTFGPSVRLAHFAALVFALVVAAVGPRTTRAYDVAAAPATTSARLGRTGVVLQVIGLVLFLATLFQSGGFDLLSGGYLSFLENVESSGVAYGIWAFGIGSCLTQLGTRSQSRTGLTIYMLYAVILFPLGLRGSVLFPGAVLLATRARMGRRLPTSVLASAAVGVLTLSAVVRSTRIGDDVGAGTWYTRALSTVTELGFSLRPVTEALRWAQAGQEPTHFVSFVAVPIRLVEKFTGWHGGPPAVDQRLFNVKVNVLSGPIGGSPVAEAYDAGRTLGVLLVMAGLALAIATISRLELSTAMRAAAFPIVLLPLVTAVRNSFAPVLPQILIGLLVAYLATKPGSDGRAPLRVKRDASRTTLASPR